MKILRSPLITPLLIIALIMTMTLTMVACKNTSTNTNANNTNANTEDPTKNSNTPTTENQIIANPTVLEGYPLDLVPLYQVTKVKDSYYSVRDNLDYVAGKDIYVTSFESAASKDDISKYYTELFDDIDEASSTDPYSLEGEKGGRHLMVMIFDPSTQDEKGNGVIITIGAEPKDYVEYNPYLTNSSITRVKTEFVDVIKDTTYMEYYIDRMNRYVISYNTTADPNEITTFYRELYKNATNFTETTDATYTYFQWKDGELNCRVSYNNSEDVDTISIAVDEPRK